MAPSACTRCMDDFLINPTVSSDHESHLSKDLYAMKPQFFQTSETKGKASVYNDMAFDFWPTYTSDEEATSPIDDDSASQYSVSSDFSIPEVVEASAHSVEQQCARAQTVVIQSAGRARMVSMPKTADALRQSMCIAPANESFQPSLSISKRRSSIARTGTTRSSQETTHSSSRTDSLSSNAPPSPMSTAPSSVSDEVEERPVGTHKRRISRHIDLMQAARAITPTSPTSPTPSKAWSFAGIPSSPSIRRKGKFTPGAALNRIGKTFVRRESSAEDTASIHQREPVNVTLNVTQPKRYSSGRPKLIARAANERAAPIVLPPFPDA